ncbi:MAG TPA: hypothetical protein PKD09_22755 [Aggregatilinea sp.]|jgi:hypothetical protein|uniref:hypothetical protein n=1 Tax=Aggregatilinea sp. TaxID=2806333 RepID=UPI002C62C3F9|nr:hypothetical protein [Aggregatilinea sp.]HML24490.1 hypothetical protein [Aggregatilinea sp.]
MEAQQFSGARAGYVAAEFLTRSYRINAEVNTRGAKLLDELNDHMAQFVQIERAYVSPLYDPATLTGSYDLGQIRKDSLALVVLKQMRDGLPHREGQYMGRDHIERAVQIMAGGFEVQGVIRLHPTVDLSSFLRTTPEAFVPVFDATATAAGRKEVIFGGAVILVNRTRLELFFTGSR